MSRGRGGPTTMPRWAGAPPRNKFFYVNFRRKTRPHPLEFFVRTPWNFSGAPLGIFRQHTIGRKYYGLILYIF
ncbi:hypothetical protein Hanom_Chr14g01254281 [Helianthus anomalus]